MSKTLMLAVCLALTWSGMATAQTQASTNKASPEDLKRVESLQYLMGITTIADEHPDAYYRKLGIQAYQDGNKQHALQLLLKSASYADKLAQALVATMYWSGDGTAVDRPRAYAWMDLAADRGYRDLLIQRERYWSQLNEAERKQALDIGSEVYAEYSDARGLDRLQLKLSAFAANSAGSHAGFVGNGATLYESGWANGSRAASGASGSLAATLGSTNGEAVDDSKLYAADVWNAKTYARLKDVEWNLQTGHVEVGDLQVVHKPIDDSSSSH